MALYLYYCPVCDHSFEIKKPMAKSTKDEPCPKCGVKALRKYTPTAFTFGWRLTDACHEIGGPKYAEVERDI